MFVSDHFQPWKHTGGHAPFSFAWLAALGAKTSRVQIGTSVATPTFRYHPSVVAQAFGTLGAMFPGRVILGVGTGESLNEVPATGMKWPGFKERQGRLRESIDLIRRLWTEERVTFEGQYYRTLAATIYDRPEKPVPIWIAASGPTAAAMAGEIGDGFICTSGKGDALYRETLLPKVDEGLKRAGRPGGTIERMIEVGSFGRGQFGQCRVEADRERLLAIDLLACAADCGGCLVEVFPIGIEGALRSELSGRRAVGSCLPIRRSSWPRSDPISSSGSPTSSSTLPAPTSAGSSSSTPSRSCRCFARSSGEHVARLRQRSPIFRNRASLGRNGGGGELRCPPPS